MYDSTCIRNPGGSQMHQDKKENGGCSGQEKRGMGNCLMGIRAEIWKDEKNVWRYRCLVMVAKQSECI